MVCNNCMYTVHHAVICTFVCCIQCYCTLNTIVIFSSSKKNCNAHNVCRLAELEVKEEVIFLYCFVGWLTYVCWQNCWPFALSVCFLVICWLRLVEPINVHGFLQAFIGWITSPVPPEFVSM